MAATPLQALRDAIQGFNKQDRQLVEHALEAATKAHAGQTRKDGSPYIEHPIEVAVILAQWNADAATIAAALLHDAIEDTPMTRDAIAAEFGETIAQLVEGVTKITETDLTLRQGSEGQLTLDRKTETLRKLFDVMRQDIRALVIKMADRVHNVRTIHELAPDRQVRFAKETLDIYYKLAYHLGMNDVRREFSERCVPIVHSDEGMKLVAMRAHQLSAAVRIATTVEEKLRALDERHAIQSVRLEGHSLVSLLHDSHQPDFNKDQAIYVVIVTKDEDGCYATLKNLHGLFRPRSALFRDYIASPARNGYRALHTTVLDEANDMLDVRIRTEKMDEEERLGLLRYCFTQEKWSGKEFEWLQSSAAFDDATRENSAAFLQALQSDILQENITIVVDGQEVQVPDNATALDAVYARHGTHAHEAMAVQRNGTPGLFGETIEEDDALDTVFSEHRQVRFEWLNWVMSAYARTLIVEALKTRSREEKLSVGRDLLQKELDRYRKGYVGDLSRTQQETVAKQMERSSFDDVLAMIGEGSIPPEEVALVLWPERRPWRPWPRRHEGPKRFQIYVSGTHLRKQEILPRIATVAERAGTDIESTQIRFHERSGTYGAIVRGRTPGRAQLADFLSALDRAEWTSNVYAMLSQMQRLALGLAFAVAATIVVVDILLLPFYERLLVSQTSMSWLAIEIVPLIPILAVNYFLLRILRKYSVRLRQDRWFLGVGFILNIFGVVLVLWKVPLLQGSTQIYPLLFIFALSMLLLAFRYARSFFGADTHEQRRALTSSEWKALRRRKRTGYLLRFGAVLIWGLEPVLIRYTSLQDLSPLLRVNLWAIIGTVCGFVVILVMNVFRKRTEQLRYSTPYNRYFCIIVIANISYNYFLHASLLFTTATNVNLVLSYAPIFSLLLGVIIWRSRISYFRSAKAMQQMVMVFCLSAIGGSLLFLNDMKSTRSGVIGDMMALVIAFSDVGFMMANIYYVKYSKALTNTLALTTQHLLWIGIVTTIILQVLNITGVTEISYALTREQWIASIALGAITMLGFVLTFEAFRRIDGLLAFLMLNLAPVIAFIPEFLFFDVPITAFFVIGAVLIVGASVGAELVNSRSEKKGL